MEFPVPLAKKILSVHCTLICADGGNQLYNLLKNDQVSYVAEKLVEGRSFPSNIFGLLSSLFKKFDEAELSFDSAVQRSEVLWDYLKQLRLLKYKILDDMKRLNVDVLLAPVLPLPALRVVDAEELVSKSQQ